MDTNEGIYDSKASEDFFQSTTCILQSIGCVCPPINFLPISKPQQHSEEKDTAEHSRHASGLSDQRQQYLHTSDASSDVRKVPIW